MANTTNFGWETPDDTDLVKDGAAAIRTLGSAIDTSLVDLKGGTTGQVLSKASNTDMDFTWVAQDDSNAIQNALLTTTGDTIYASSASTPARLGIGTTGQFLTVSAGGIPAWTTVSTGSLTLLSTTSLSGASTTISGISGAYQHLQVQIYGVSNATADGNFLIDPNGSTTITSGGAVSNNISSPGRYINQSIRLIAENGPKFNNTSNNFVFTIFNYSQTSYSKNYQGGGSYVEPAATLFQVGTTFYGFINTTSAITSLVFRNTGGNLSTGTVLLYGVK